MNTKKQNSLILKGYDDLAINKLVVTSFLRNNQTALHSHILEKYIIHEDDALYNDSLSVECETLEDVINLFEIAVPGDQSTTNGAVYTPKTIRDRIVDYCFSRHSELERVDLDSFYCADLSCGCGAFLYTAALRIMKDYSCSFKIACSRLYGFDICVESIERTKILLALAAINFQENLSVDDLHLITGNTLAVLPDHFSPHFNVIIGNPPYVRSKNISPDSKAYLNKWIVSKLGNADLYIPFFEIGYRLLTDNGVLGFITPNSFFKSVNGRELRNLFSKNHLHLVIENFGDEKVFGKKMVYTCLTYFDKDSCDHISYSRVSLSQLDQNLSIQYSIIPYESLNNHKGWTLSDSTVLKNIHTIESIGPSLGKSFTIKNGIATLANDIFIFKPQKDDSKYYYFENGGNIVRIEKVICRDIIKPNKLKSEDEIPTLLEKVIFPYRADYSPLDESEFLSIAPYAYHYLESHKYKLQQRDKGQCDYPWFLFGRTQAIEDHGKKLLFPYIADEPHFVYTSNESMLIYCGYAIFHESEEELLILKRILESKVFDYYMKHTSKPYSGGFFSYAKNMVKNFGLCPLSKKDRGFLLHENDKELINLFLMKKYGVSL